MEPVSGALTFLFQTSAGKDKVVGLFPSCIFIHHSCNKLYQALTRHQGRSREGARDRPGNKWYKSTVT